MSALPEPIDEPLKVEARLHELGLSLDVFHESMHAALLAWASCTENDPPSYPGTTLWAVAMRHLREQLLPKGWTKSDAANYCTVVNPDTTLAIAVATGDEATGVNKDGIQPKTKCPKGPETQAIVANNRQLDFFIAAGATNQMQVPLTYILLLARTEEGLRGELSLPEEIGLDERVERWRERIILPPLGGDSDSLAMTAPEPAPLPEIDVVRRADTG